ncbi:OmpP1/FadL family transporter [candidate division CSSED10-310 bacterium]|uniref:OmpP1/FadL family transporter n=1 Tax=candidate division CSSED10-310 bacterium TaxID=2855610 RepID=A0ABV6Z5W9_UNCC1
MAWCGWEKTSASLFFSFLFLVIVCVTPLVEGGAFYFPQVGARAASMGNAFVAVADDASNVFHNPAGMTQIEEAVGNYSADIIFPVFTYKREANDQVYATEYQQLRVMTPFYLGFVSPSKDYEYTSGFAFYDAWGGLPMWRKEASSRYILKHMFLIVLHGTYSMAYPLTKSFSIGGGLSLIYCYMQQNKSLDFQDLAGKEAEEDYYNEMDILMTGDTFGFGGNIGCLYKPTENLSFGLTYTPQVDLNFDAEMKSTTPFLMSALMDEMTLKAKVTMYLPHNVRGGFAFRISERLLAAFDVTWVNWDVSKDTNVNFDEGEFFIKERDHIAIPRYWQDSMTYSVGLEYNFDKWNIPVLRCGYTYDEWAIPEYTMMIDNPDANKHNFSFGGSYIYDKKVTIDFGYEVRFYDDRHVTNSVYTSDDPAIVGGVANGYYKEMIHALYIGVRMLQE